MTALEERPTATLVCGYYPRAGVPVCGSTDDLRRLFIGWRCPTHTLPGAQVYELPPAPAAPTAGPTDVPADAVDAPGLISPGRSVVGGDTGSRGGRPPSRLPAPDRPMAAVQLDGHGAAEQAAALVMPKTGKPRRRLLDRFVELDTTGQGMTSWEAWRWYCETHGPIDLYTLRPRLTELKKDGWIADSGNRRHPRGQGDTAAPAEEVLVLTWRGRQQAGALQ